MNELIEYSLDTENGEKNYHLARWYESIGHTAPAHTYYLRASERTEDDVLGNVYNRLVIFDASAIHSASEYFGTIKENARLWQMFFFDNFGPFHSNIHLPIIEISP